MTTAKKNQALAIVPVSEYPALVNKAEALEALKDNADMMMESGQNTPLFRRVQCVKVPGGGGMTWEIPALEGVVSKQTIEGVVIHIQAWRGYWEQRSGENGVSNRPPDCSSMDLIHGVGNPGMECARCPLNEWGSGIGADGNPSKGKACKEKRYPFILQKEGSVLPIAIQLPATSLKAFGEWAKTLNQSALSYWKTETAFSLVKVQGGGINYSTVKVTPVRALPPEEVAQIKAYRDEIAPHMGRHIADVIEDTQCGDGEMENEGLPF